MTAFWLIAFCLTFIVIAGTLRRRPGSAITDVTVLVGLFGIIAVVDLIVGRWVYTGDTAWTLAAILAALFAFDSLYGLMAPDRQKRRNRQLRQLMQRRRA